MMQQVAAQLFVLYTTLVLFLFAFYGPWQTSCVSAARQRIFAARERLFDFCRDGGMDFSEPAQREARHLLNGMIRFAHLTSWTSLLLFLALKQRRSIPSNPGLDLTTSNMTDAQAREKIDGEVREAMRALFVLVAERSLLLFPVVLLVRFLALGNSLSNRVVQKCGSVVEQQMIYLEMGETAGCA